MNRLLTLPRSKYVTPKYVTPTPTRPPPPTPPQPQPHHHTTTTHTPHTHPHTLLPPTHPLPLPNLPHPVPPPNPHPPPPPPPPTTHHHHRHHHQIRDGRQISLFSTFHNQLRIMLTILQWYPQIAHPLPTTVEHSSPPIKEHDENLTFDSTDT